MIGPFSSFAALATNWLLGFYSEVGGYTRGMSPPCSLIRPNLGLDALGGHGLEVHGLVFQPVAVLVPQGMLEPVHVVARMVVGAVVRAARLGAGLRRHHG